MIKKKWKRHDLQRDMGCCDMTWNGPSHAAFPWSDSQPRFGDSKGSPVWSSMKQLAMIKLNYNGAGNKLPWLMIAYDGLGCLVLDCCGTTGINMSHPFVRIYTDLWSLYIYTGVVPADEHCLMCKGRWTWWSFRWRARCLLMDCCRWLNSFEFNTFHSHCTRPPCPKRRLW